VRKAIEVQPGAAQIFSQLAIVQIPCGIAAMAVELALHESDPFWGTYALALSEFAAGNRAGADEALAALTRDWADSGALQIARVHALRLEPEKRFEWFDHAYATRDSGLTGHAVCAVRGCVPNRSAICSDVREGRVAAPDETG